MPDREEIIRSLTNHYSIKVIKAFNDIDGSSLAIQVMAKSLNELYRYFEPAFFNGKLFVIKTIDDTVLLDEANAIVVYDKNILLSRITGNMVIQVFEDGSIKLWDNEEITDPTTITNTLIYFYNNHKEYLYANGTKIDITIAQKGSRFATQFEDLLDSLKDYENSKVLYSSCSYFTQSWDDRNRLFFKGGGKGNNIPEKFMQESLYEFLSTALARGITIDSVREYNIVGDYNKPKPVDVKITWREANRVAIIEIKFLGMVKPASGAAYTHDDRRANEGIFQLKGYYDKILSDSPTTIIKSYLLVFEGRRNNLVATQTTINYVDGMFYKDVELVIDSDKKYHESVPGFEKPIKVFAAPITV
jgi:hypothetical protein